MATGKASHISEQQTAPFPERCSSSNLVYCLRVQFQWLMDQAQAMPSISIFHAGFARPATMTVLAGRRSPSAS